MGGMVVKRCGFGEGGEIRGGIVKWAAVQKTPVILITNGKQGSCSPPTRAYSAEIEFRNPAKKS